MIIVPLGGLKVKVRQTPTEWIVEGELFRTGRGSTLVEAWEAFLQDRETWVAACEKYWDDLRKADASAEEATEGDQGQEAPSNQVPESD